MKFNGSDYSSARDDARLSGQLCRVWEVMQDGQWRTLQQIASAAQAPPASVSAQLRHLRKDRFGNHEVQKNYLGNGLYEYRVVANPSGLTPPQIFEIQHLL